MELFRLDCIFRRDVPLKELTSFGIGGKAAVVVCPKNAEEVNNIIFALNAENMEWFPLGRGTNVLASDAGFDGIIIHFNRYMSRIRVERGLVICEAGTATRTICDCMLQNDMSGGEFLACIPSSAGGATIGNSGCFGQEMSQIVEYVLAADGRKTRIFTRDELDFSHRNSFFKRNREWTVVEIGFRFKTDGKGGVGLIKEMKDRKRLNQPTDLPSAGCVFSNIGAGKLIEEMGLKGFRSGGAEISVKHANFIVNKSGTASCEDVLCLLSKIIDVAKTRGVTLETEIDFLPRKLALSLNKKSE